MQVRIEIHHHESAGTLLPIGLIELAGRQRKHENQGEFEKQARIVLPQIHAKIFVGGIEKFKESIELGEAGAGVALYDWQQLRPLILYAVARCLTLYDLRE